MWPAAVWLVVAVGCLFVVGEEISWGQRILHFQTPEELRKINRQEEANIHNIRTILNGLNATLLLGGLYGAVAPWLARWVGKDGERPRDIWLFVPPIFLTSSFAVVFAYKFSRFTIFRTSRYTIVRLGEWAELCFAFGLSMFALLVWWRLRNRPVADAPTGNGRGVAR
jgi:hypothetical protein